MNLAVTVLEIVAPVFLLAGVGFAWVRVGLEYRIQFVTRLAMTLALPCLMFTALMRTDIEPEALTRLSLATLAAYGGVTLVMWLLVAGLRLERRTYLSPLIFGNTGNLGLPLAFFAFGEQGLGYAVVIFAIMAVWNFTFGIWVVSGGVRMSQLLREPVVGATLLGALFLWQGWETPRFLTNALDLMGQMAIPLMLITLGVAVARLTPTRVTRAVALSLAKLVLCVAIAWGVAGLLDLPAVAAAVLVLQVATPVAVTSYLIAEKFDVDAQAVAGLVLVSTLMSVAALPALLAVLL